MGLNKINRCVLCVVLVICVRIAALANDTVAVRDSAWYHEKWYNQLFQNGFKIHEPGINYPKFPRFCLNVYDWGNRTFNTYDTRYVVGTGKNWKVMGRSYNWGDSYALFFDKDSYLRMQSGMYSDVGVYLCFMAVSVGYAWNVNKMFQHTDDSRKTFDFNFCCALFSADLNMVSSKGGTKIRHFGDYDGGKTISYNFNDISFESISGDIYYFFNHSRYSQAAAYSYSKYQLRSAGSWIVGLGMAYRNIDMDFSSLPPDMLEALPNLKKQYMFRYTDYEILGGYAYNWVFRPKWLFNVTTLPSIGYKHSYENATDGRKDLFATNLKLRFSLTYNHKALFVGMLGRMDGHFYLTNGYSFFNAVETLSLNVGARF